MDRTKEHSAAGPWLEGSSCLGTTIERLLVELGIPSVQVQLGMVEEATPDGRVHHDWLVTGLKFRDLAAETHW